MVGGVVLQVALGIGALALAIWMLVPTVAYLLGARRIDIDVYAEPPLARPYPEDADGLRRYGQLVELGFQPVGWTSEHARFFTPLHWTWRSVQGARWLVAPDGLTFASLYRVVEDEPVRFSAMTLLDDGGSVTTAYPGAGLPLNPASRHSFCEMRGVGPAELLAGHAENVETIRRERGVAVKGGTLADVAAASLACSREHIAKQRLGALALLPLFALGISIMVALPVLEMERGERAQLFALGGVVFTGLLYALMRQLLIKPSHAARQAHTREFDLEQTAVAADGTIAAGRFEPWLRRLAVVGALDMVLRLAVLAWKVPKILRLGTGTIIMAAVVVWLCALDLGAFIPRVSGRMNPPRWKKAQAPANLWTGWGSTALICFMLTKNAYTPPYIAWLATAGGLALAGWWLEKNGRT